jgi:VWFA-related protein
MILPARFASKEADMSVLRHGAAGRIGLVLMAGLLGGGMAVIPYLRSQVSAEAQKPLQYNVSVTLKLVQVYVSGKDGRPMGDLDASEFEVFDNGRSMPVTHFEKHLLGSPERASGEASREAAEPKLNRKFLLLFDFAFIEPRGILKARNAGLHFIDAELRPGDEVSVLTYTAMRGLVLHEYLVTDHQSIRRIVDGFGLRNVTGRAENLSDYVYSVDLTDPEKARDEANMNPEERIYMMQARLQTGGAGKVEEGTRQGYVERVHSFIETLRNLAVALRYIPGYKNVIIFSGGIARQVLFGRPGGIMPGGSATPEEFARQMRDFDAAQADSGLRDDFSKMVEEFKAANCPIYALDVSRSMQEADMTGSQVLDFNSRWLQGADSLKQLASGTGGRFFANTVDYKDSMAVIQNVTGSYYVLGYSVPETWDGKFHKIKVKVRRKGCDVVAQGGYFSPKPFKEYSSFEKLIHMTDLALGDVPELQVPEGFSVSAIPVTFGGRTRLLVYGKASRRALSDVMGKKAEAYLLLCEEGGAVSAIKSLRLTYPEPPRETYFPSFLVEAKPGRYTCRLVLRNMDTGRGARGAFQVTIPEKPASAPAFDPPLFLVKDRLAADLAGSEGSSPSGLFAYDAGAYAPLVGALPAGVEKLYAVLRSSSGEAGLSGELSASLKEAAGTASRDIPVTVVKKTESWSAHLILVELGTGVLKPGRYMLTVFVKGRTGEVVPVTTGEFVVK